MEQIEFKGDVFTGFFPFIGTVFSLDVRKNDNMLNAFNGQLEGVRKLRDRLINYPSDVPAFQGVKNQEEHRKILSGQLMELFNQVRNGQISDINGLTNFLSSRFGVKTDEIEACYQSYRSFFEENRSCIDTNLKAMRHIYSDGPIQMPNLPTDENMPKTTGAFLESMRHFFEVPADKKPTVCLHPFPDDPHLSGWANADTINQTFCTKRLETDDKYVEGTTMLSRRIGTPMHEIGHWMFFNSAMIGEFEKTSAERSPAVQQFISTMEAYFSKYPEENYSSPSPLGAMHEALASSAGVVMRPDSMKDFDYKTAELYWGFKAGNDLARIVYPIFHEYIASGKTMSDGFFERLVSDKEFQRCFGAQDHSEEQTKKSSICQILRECSNAKGKGVDESQSDVFAPVRTPVPQQLDAAGIMMLRNQNKTNGH
ncbi:MAG: hypothetical protein IKY98_04345 [Alphaproteobacteria bacterium]|nr:hypothetical protein [Alphaproteobacteria bacterium]